MLSPGSWQHCSLCHAVGRQRTRDAWLSHNFKDEATCRSGVACRVALHMPIISICRRFLVELLRFQGKDQSWAASINFSVHKSRTLQSLGLGSCRSMRSEMLAGHAHDEECSLKKPRHCTGANDKSFCNSLFGARTSALQMTSNDKDTALAGK